MWLKQSKPWKITIVDSIMVVGVLTHCALLHFVYDLKNTQMNRKCSLIWEVTLYEFEWDNNTEEASKNIWGAKSESTVELSTVMKWFKKFSLGCKNLSYPVKSGRPKSMDSETIFQAIEENLVSSTHRVSGKLNISLYSVVHHFQDLGKTVQSCQIVPHITKISKIFDLLHYVCFL